MSRYTSSYTRLLGRLHEVDMLLQMARIESRGTPTPTKVARVNALCRSGVVLLSSHIEGYVEEVGALALTRIVAKNLPKGSLGSAFRYYLSRDIIKTIREAADVTKITSSIDEIWVRDRNIWDGSPTFTNVLSADVFVGGFANPTHEKIKRFFGRFGYGTYHGDMGGLLAADFAPCRNMIDQVIEQRNRIAHGDVTTIGTPADLADMLRLVRQYCRAADNLVGNWFRSIQCPIR